MVDERSLDSYELEDAAVIVASLGERRRVGGGDNKKGGFRFFGMISWFVFQVVYSMLELICSDFSQ